jgi:hypothetical protein
LEADKVSRKYLVFLDIDGVFTSARVNIAHNASYEMWHRFDPVAIDFMNKIHDMHEVEFVLMSTWKNYIDVSSFQVEHWIKAAFGNSGFKGQFAAPWKTDPKESWINNAGMMRGDEVRMYLDEYGTDVDDFIMFDDNRYNFKEALGKNRLVWTDSDDGLLFKHMRIAQSMMGTWDKK